MSEGTKTQRTKRAGALAERFCNKRSVGKCVWQDEKDFMLEVPLNHQNSRVYGKNQKGDISACNWTRTYNHLVHKRTLNHLGKLAE